MFKDQRSLVTLRTHRVNRVLLDSVPDPDLEMGGGGGSHPDPELRGAQSPQKWFWPFGPQFGLNISGGVGVGESPKPLP